MWFFVPGECLQEHLLRCCFGVRRAVPARVLCVPQGAGIMYNMRWALYSAGVGIGQQKYNTWVGQNLGVGTGLSHWQDTVYKGHARAC